MEEIIAAQLAKFLAPLAAVPVAVAPPEQHQEAQLFQIGGRFRRAPEDFVFPSGEKRTAHYFHIQFIFAFLSPNRKAFRIVVPWGQGKRRWAVQELCAGGHANTVNKEATL
jgi:hypothetical protein